MDYITQYIFFSIFLIIFALPAVTLIYFFLSVITNISSIKDSFSKEDQKATADYKNRILADFAKAHNYTYRQADKELMPLGLYADDINERFISGTLPESKNTFKIYSHSRKVFGSSIMAIESRTCLRVDIPDTKYQVLIDSKKAVTSEYGGGIVDIKNIQKLTLEGDFSKHFNVYTPANTEINTLTILAPNAMEYLQQELGDYDIEITGTTLLAYATDELIDTELIKQLITKTDVLLKKVKLRLADAKTTRIENKKHIQKSARAANDNTVFKPLKSSGLKQRIVELISLALGTGLVIIIMINTFNGMQNIPTFDILGISIIIMLATAIVAIIVTVIKVFIALIEKVYSLID